MQFIPPQPEQHAAIAATLPSVKVMIGEKSLAHGSAGTFEHVNTATGRKQAEVPLAGAAEVEQAVAAARAAFPAWRDMKPYRRRQILDRFDAAAAQRTCAQVRALGRQCLGETADATDTAQLAAFYESAGRFLQRAEIVVNVVGGVRMRPFMDKDPAECGMDIRRNFGYVIESVRHAVPLLRKSGRGGSIVNFTTIEAQRAAGGFAVYAGAKAATTNFSRAMAWELGPEGIRVNVIAPDTTDSPGNRNALPPEVHAMGADLPAETLASAMQMYIPLQAPPTRDDLANAVLFLASDLARSITGQVLHVDGGTSAAAGMIRWPHDGGLTLPVPMGNTLRKLFPRR